MTIENIAKLAAAWNTADDAKAKANDTANTAALAAIHLSIWHCMENGISAKQKKLVGAFKNELIAAGVSKRHATTISPLATSAKIHKVLADNGAECAGDVGGCLTDDDGNEFTTLAALKAFIKPAPKRSKESRAWADVARAALPEALREYLTEEMLADMYLKAEKRAGKADEKAAKQADVVKLVPVAAAA